MNKNRQPHMRERDAMQDQAHRDGYRSKEIYSLLEIDQKDRIFKPGQLVVDLGACPGSFSEYALEKVGRKGRVIGLDKREIFNPVPNLEYVVGDFHDEAVFNELIEMLNGDKIDVVLSDMEPRISGIKDVDQSRRIYLAELAYDLAINHLNKGGAFITRMSKGKGFDEYLQALRDHFSKVRTQNIVEQNADPRREKTPVLYLVATGFRG